MYDWDWPGAHAEYERAIALKPNYALALNHYSYGLAFVGQFDRAIEMSKAELELDPLSVTANFDLAASISTPTTPTKPLSNCER